MRELSLRACRAFCLAVGAVALALCMGLFCQPEEAHAEDIDIRFTITDVNGNDLSSGEPFDAEVLQQGFWIYPNMDDYAAAELIGAYLYITDQTTGQETFIMGTLGGFETGGEFFEILNNRIVFLGGHSYDFRIDFLRRIPGSVGMGSHAQEVYCSASVYVGTAAEEVPDGSGDGDGDGSGELDGDGTDAPVDVGPDDDGDDGSGGGEGADDDTSTTDDSGSDDATGEGGADEDDGVAPIAPGSESDSSSQDSGTGAAASSRTSDSEGSEVEATEEGGTARADASGGSDSESGQAEDDEAGSPQAETTAVDLAQLGEVYKVGQSTESDGETTEQSSSIQLAQFEVYGIPLIVLMVAIVLFGSLPFGVATRLGALGFGVRRRTRLG